MCSCKFHCKYITKGVSHVLEEFQGCSRIKSSWGLHPQIPSLASVTDNSGSAPGKSSTALLWESRMHKKTEKDGVHKDSSTRYFDKIWQSWAEKMIKNKKKTKSYREILAFILPLSLWTNDSSSKHLSHAHDDGWLWWFQGSYCSFGWCESLAERISFSCSGKSLWLRCRSDVADAIVLQDLSLIL